jgi:hypothetical protein
MKFYSKKSNAIEAARSLSKCGNIQAVVEGPENNWCVMTLKDAIDSEMPYEWFV